MLTQLDSTGYCHVLAGGTHLVSSSHFGMPHFICRWPGGDVLLASVESRQELDTILQVTTAACLNPAVVSAVRAQPVASPFAAYPHTCNHLSNPSSSKNCFSDQTLAASTSGSPTSSSVYCAV